MKYQCTSDLKRKFTIFVAFLQKLKALEIIFCKKTCFVEIWEFCDKNEIPLCSREINCEFLIIVIPAMTIFSSNSVSCCLAEVCPRRKCENPLLVLHLHSKAAQRRKRVHRHWNKEPRALSSAASMHVVSPAHFWNNGTRLLLFPFFFLAHLQFVPNSESLS